MRPDLQNRRPGRANCSRAREFLARMGIQPASLVDARKVKFDRTQALRIAREASEIYVTKGKRVTHLSIRKDSPDDETLAHLILGRTGYLRSPTIRKGATLLVGFDEDTYRAVFT